jgi:hypothetical protein
MKSGLLAAAVLLPAWFAHGQVTITSSDMFSAVGQYYRVYAGNKSADVTGLLGNPGGPQTWDFSTNGPTNLIYRFEYAAPSDSGVGDDFPLAQVAEKQVNELNGTTMAWLFLKQTSGTGRINYGFYSPDSMPSEGQFNPPITDFPDPMKYQDSWTIDTTYDSSIGDSTVSVPITIEYTATVSVDAYGTIILPGLGSLECLRINELDKYETLVDLSGSGDMTSYDTEYIRIYYFISPGHGVVATIDSDQTSSAPSASFTSAAQFTRLFDFSRSTAQSPGAVTNLTLKIVADAGVLLSWSKTLNTVSYRVEYSPNPAGTNAWQELATTTGNSYFDTDTSDSQQRFYRVVSLGK